MRFAITVEEVCKRLRPVLGRKVDLLYLKYKLSDAKEKKEEIEQALYALYEKNLKAGLLQEKILLEPPEGNAVKGIYPMGIVSYAERDFGNFGLNERDWPRHICVTGMSGSGKTNLAFVMLKNFLSQQKPFIAFDWKKSFRPLMTLDDDLMCFTIGNDRVANWFRINVNKPPKGVAPKEWIGILCDIINEAFGASFGVHKLLSETLDRAFYDFGVYDGSDNYPTWLQIKDRLEEIETEFIKKSGRESEWLTSALRVAHALTFGAFGKALNYKGEGAMSVEDLLNKKVIFELNALNNSEKKFFAELVLTYIYKMKKASDDSSFQGFKSAILVDEAHNIFLKKRTNFLSESITETVYRDIREYGISLICLDQHISKLSEVVVGNSATSIAFQQMLPDDIYLVSGLMQIKEYGKYFSMLPIGHAIVKLADRYYSPFLVKVPLMELKSKAVADSEVMKRMQKLFSHLKKIKSFEESCRIERIREKLYTKKVERKVEKKPTAVKEKKLTVPPIKNHIQRDLTIFITQLRSFGYDMETIRKNLLNNGFSPRDIRVAMQNLPLKKIAPCKLNKEQIKFLIALKKKGPMATTKAYDVLKLSPRKGNEMKEYLLEKGMLEVTENKFERGRIKLLSLAPKAKHLVESYA